MLHAKGNLLTLNVSDHSVVKKDIDEILEEFIGGGPRRNSLINESLSMQTPLFQKFVHTCRPGPSNNHGLASPAG